MEDVAEAKSNGGKIGPTAVGELEGTEGKETDVAVGSVGAELVGAEK